MEDIIGRETEIKILRDALRSPRSEFVAVYGRRRVGKTFLIKSVFHKELFFEMTGINGTPLQKQLRNFHLALKVSAAKRGLIAPPKENNWLDAFQQLKSVIEQSNQSKKVIFFDELPWIDSHKSGFLTGLEHFWNSWAAFHII